MTRRIPILPTILVVLAVLLMIRLGVWQLDRRHEKDALLARYATNAVRPPVALPALWPVKEADLFRRVAADCLSVTGWTTAAGRSTTGETGWRHIASCRTGAEGPGFSADMGESQSSDPPRWTGGPVAGHLTWTPTGEPLIARLFGNRPPPTPMIVADAPAPGLAAPAAPDPATVPNNHLAYAVQWFLFAGVAVVIYGILLWRRSRAAPPVAPPSPQG